MGIIVKLKMVLKVTKRVLIIFSSICVLLLSGCYNEPEFIDPQLMIYQFEEAIKIADLIAKVEIGKKTKEVNEEHFQASVYEAKIIESYKNENGEEEIVILQEGNSKVIFNGNHQFQKGEQYILFLRTAFGDNFSDKYNPYVIVSDEVYTFSINSINNENYVIKRISLNEDDLKDKKITDSIAFSLLEKMKENKQKYEQIKEVAVYKEKDFVELLNQFLKVSE